MASKEFVLLVLCLDYGIELTIEFVLLVLC
jgi:hypothetical protein